MAASLHFSCMPTNNQQDTAFMLALSTYGKHLPELERTYLCHKPCTVQVRPSSFRAYITRSTRPHPVASCPNQVAPVTPCAEQHKLCHKQHQAATSIGVQVGRGRRHVHVCSVRLISVDMLIQRIHAGSASATFSYNAQSCTATINA